MINIYGKGGHARMIASLLEYSVLFYDENDFLEAKNHPWIIGVGDNESRKKISEKLKHVDFINIDLSTYVGSDVKIGLGTLIAPGTVIQNAVIIGKHTIINTSASVDHDCEIGDYCHIAPNTTLCGAVKIGDGTMIGAGSVILPGIRVGESCIVGAGSVVTRNIPSHSKVFGNPGKIQNIG
jgi:sugar O-acyltransferase (sialic acid O-acetyltransferase NeuD family)